MTWTGGDFQVDGGNTQESSDASRQWGNIIMFIPSHNQPVNADLTGNSAIKMRDVC